jgi:hypothetical protein
MFLMFCEPSFRSVLDLVLLVAPGGLPGLFFLPGGGVGDCLFFPLLSTLLFLLPGVFIVPLCDGGDWVGVRGSDFVGESGSTGGLR